jgi:hypothetical protein
MMHFGMHCGHINNYWTIADMNFFRPFLFFMGLTSAIVFASQSEETESSPPVNLPKVGCCIFSGVATNENGERFGYFFQMKRQGCDLHAKTALIDGQTNKLILFYEGHDTLGDLSSLNWHVGSSFMRYNPINDSWIFGVKMANKQGFNFKVDTLKKENDTTDTRELKPGVELQALETTRLNGHITGIDNKEQFVTGNKAWFARIRLSKAQKEGPAINTTFCRLNDNNGFYAAKLKESASYKSAIASWRDPAGAKLKMSKFISIQSLANDECLLHVGSPKLDMKLYNTLKGGGDASHALAGFSSQVPMGFCFVEEQSFLPFA